MTDIKRKALALVNEVEREEGENELTRHIMRGLIMDEALCRAIERHEAFKQEVSDALLDSWYYNASGKSLERFIIPKPEPEPEPEPDPLVDALRNTPIIGLTETADDFRKRQDLWVFGECHSALEARGLEIRNKANDD